MTQKVYFFDMFSDYEPPEELRAALSQAAVAAADIDAQHRRISVALESDLYIPNCITPNLPTNNKFDIIHDEAFIIDDVYIYNRAGGLIFHSPNNAESWNGKYKGIPCPQASYTYIIYYHKERINERYEKVGTVLLLY